jgi:hypothetical protein
MFASVFDLIRIENMQSIIDLLRLPACEDSKMAE